MPDPALQRNAILQALERLLAWPEMARSPQLGKFLDYIVRRTLDGDEQSIKAYSIAVDVLGRGADFDPQADPIVRVQARRLRGLLDEFYGSAGQDETVRISLPIGRYVPEFTPAVAPAPLEMAVAESEPAAEPEVARARLRGGITISWFALAVIVAAMVVLAFALSTWVPRQPGGPLPSGAVQVPSVTIVEFQNLAGSTPGGPMVAGLAIELVTDLEQFEDIEVRYGGGGATNVAPGAAAASDYMLTGIVRPDGLMVQYSAILTDSVTGDVVWNYTIPIASEAALQADVLDRVWRSFSLVLGSPRGPLHAAARRLLTGDAPLDGVNLYLCRMLFDLYRETGMVAQAQRADACITSLAETDRQSAIGLAMAASLTSENADLTDTSSNRVDRFRTAEANLDRAIELSPISGFVWEQHARLRETMGDFAAARTDYGSAIQLNPANADALAAYARLMAFGGDLGDAEDMAHDATLGTPDAPPWYYGVPALLALRDNDYAAAIDSAERYAMADRELGPILAILAAQGAGEGDVVNRYLPQVLDVASFRARGVLTTLRDRIEDDGLMEQIRAGLVAAGVPPQALISGF